jgi:hypothetical protein
MKDTREALRTETKQSCKHGAVRPQGLIRYGKNPQPAFPPCSARVRNRWVSAESSRVGSRRD